MPTPSAAPPHFSSDGTAFPCIASVLLLILDKEGNLCCSIAPPEAALDNFNCIRVFSCPHYSLVDEWWWSFSDRAGRHLTNERANYNPPTQIIILVAIAGRATFKTNDKQTHLGDRYINRRGIWRQARQTLYYINKVDSSSRQVIQSWSSGAVGGCVNLMWTGNGELQAVQRCKFLNGYSHIEIQLHGLQSYVAIKQ